MCGRPVYGLVSGRAIRGRFAGCSQARLHSTLLLGVCFSIRGRVCRERALVSSAPAQLSSKWQELGSVLVGL
ncbi:hypothetical protein CSUI_009605 [Cystoisospora suis]|uniref:Uncharacterized protein n=1 Tax=Cystoisospora suis TaxID=483139 RepID=A0A2C6KGB4_9APIC|nr:hypothetical protein CSUI_009605 [Cystoisospora suis]